MEFFKGRRIPAGVYVDSTMRCIECGTYITRAQEDYVVRFMDCVERQCLGCGQKLLHHSHKSLIADIHPNSEHLLDEATVKETTWYHATDRKNWMADLLDERYGNYPLVHVGTKEAAITIISDQYVRRDDWIYLYTVKLTPTAVVDERLYEDENMWPSRTDDVKGTANTFRYVNRYEATGFISLLMDPRELIIESVEAMTPIQAEEMVRQSEVFGLVMA